MSDISPVSFQRLGPPAGYHLLVVGGCGGIGHALVEHSERLGIRVTIMDLLQSGERRGIASDANFISVDLRDEQSVNDAFSRLQGLGLPVDGVAVCSGYTLDSHPVSSLRTEVFDDILSGNLRGPVLAMRAVIPMLAPDASVVLLTTGVGQIGAPGYAGYGASKAGINAIIRILAAELAPQVRVNGVAPGAVDTAFIRGGFSEGAETTGAPRRFNAEDYVRKVPMGKIGVSDDVVGPVLFLLSENARYITGQVLHVNGGALMRD